MIIKKDFLLRQLADTYVVIPVGSAALDLRGMVTLNGTGAFLWKNMQTDVTRDQLIEALTDTYEVSAETAGADVDRFLELLRENGMIEE